MAKTHQRVFALVAAVLFLATSVATGAIVVWQIRKDDQQAKQLNEAQSAADELTAENANNTQQSSLNQQEETMLKGTQLADFAPAGEVSELQTIDLVEGTGQEVKAGDTITAHYTGAYSVNGEIFESSKDSGSPATFPLSGVIEGWQQGVPGMKVGGTRRLIIPGALAYGVAPEGYTPGSTGRPMGTLVFDIELVSIGQ